MSQQSQVTWMSLSNGVSYEDTTVLMEDILCNIISGNLSDHILLTEFDDIYTCGTSASSEELLNPLNIPVTYSKRGGRVTYHGPGQRVVYPIIDLRIKRKIDIRLYIRAIEEWIIKTLNIFDIHAHRIQDLVGIWVTIDTGTVAKIGSVGIRVRKWVTYHGFAVNVNTDLKKFSGIIPCGVRDCTMTSLKELGINITMEEFDSALKYTWRYFNEML